jgi:hypothetical protein
MERYKWIAFILGCLTLVAVIVTAILRQGEAVLLFAPTIILAIFGIVVVYLVATGLLNKTRERWKALLLVAVLLLGFSVLSIFSIGLFIAPFALSLLGLSIWKLVHKKIECNNC